MGARANIATSAVTLLSETITTAGTATSTAVDTLIGATSAAIQVNFTYGSGGTTAKFYVQTSLDAGSTWTDVNCFSLTTSSARRLSCVSSAGGTAVITPTDGSLTDNTTLSPVPFGSQWRVKRISTGTYAGTTTAVVTAVFRA